MLYLCRLPCLGRHYLPERAELMQLMSVQAPSNDASGHEDVLLHGARESKLSKRLAAREGVLLHVDSTHQDPEETPPHDQSFNPP